MRVVCTDCFYRGHIAGDCQRCRGWGSYEVVPLTDPRAEAWLSGQKSVPKGKDKP